MRTLDTVSVMSHSLRPPLVRNRGYLLFCTMLGAVFGATGATGVGGALDPDVPPSGSPAWLGWVLLACVLAFMARAWFIGLRITGTHVVRHGWLRNVAVQRPRISGVGSAGYNGLPFWGSSSSLFGMVVLRLVDGQQVEVPELVGRPDTVWRLVDQLRATLGVVPEGTRRGPR